jgi:DNA sulfur modification protein DndD
MLLQKLALTNFRQFHNKSEIIFSTDIERNITLIHAENGVGKTTILNSILWCLYEKLTPDFEQPQELVCLQSVKEGIKSCDVLLEFIYEDKTYAAQRKLQSSGQIIFKLHEIEKGNWIDVPNAKSFINSILPEDMAEYFFFHGEGVSNINNKQSGTKFREAIRKILGFSLAENAVKDLDEIRKKWGKELSELKNVNEKQSKLFKEKSQELDKIEKIEKEISILISSKDQYEADLDEIENQLRNCSHNDVKKIQREIDILNINANKNNDSIRKSKLERQDLIKKYGFIIFGQKLANQALDFIDEESLKARLPAPYDESLVNDLIERELCICGRELKIGTNEYLEVTKLIEKADNAGIRKKLMKARTGGSNIKNRMSDFLSTLEKVETLLQELDNEKRNIEHELKDKQTQLGEIKIEDIIEIESKKSKCKKMLSDSEQNLGSKKHILSNSVSRLNSIELELKRHNSGDARINRLTEHQNFAESLMVLCQSELDKHEKESKKTIASKVNQTLQEFSRKDFKVKVSDDFAFSLVREDGKNVAKSRGENLLLNLSFVSALIEFAQMRSGASGDFLVRGTTAPFVIDAPFGELDNTYKSATAKFLPKRSRQLIFLLSSSHWSGTVDATIRDKVGSEYVLISSKISQQNGKPDDIIIIDDKEFTQSLYGQDKDATIIKRVK